MNMLPKPIQQEFARAEAVDGYGLVFAVRDLYETVWKICMLAVCYVLLGEDDDSFFRVILAPKQMSFGDWVNELPSVLKRTDYVRDHRGLSKFIKTLSAFYNKQNIVRWRNDFIGHGLMSAQEDKALFADAQERIAALADFLEKHPLPEDLEKLDYDNLRPFMWREGENFVLFESVSMGKDVFYTNHGTRRRFAMQQPLLTEKHRKYYGTLNVLQSGQIAGCDVYLAKDDRAVDGYHLAPFYRRPDYMVTWAEHCLENYEKGVFLLQAGRGTGKSSFALACDELNRHGQQAVVLHAEDEEVSVRAYYCSRIDVSRINDFVSYVGDILCELPSGDNIRSRCGNLPDAGTTLTDTLAFYQMQYEQFLGREKLLLFIDGIDELTEKGWGILQELPAADELPKGVYVILSCRIEMEEVPPVIRDFVCNYGFTDRVAFDVGAENHRMFVDILQELFDLSAEECDKLTQKFDNRLTVLPLLQYCTREEVLDLLAEQGELQQSSNEFLMRRYPEKLRDRYGTSYFEDFVRFLLSACNGLEALTLSELSLLSSGADTTLKQLCFLRDAAPFLVELRSYRGNVFAVSRPEYRHFLFGSYADEYELLLEEWEDWILRMDANQNHQLCEPEWDALLFLSAYLADLENAEGRAPVTRTPQRRQALLSGMYLIGISVGVADRIHRVRRASRILGVIVMTLEKVIAEGRVIEPETDLYLECAADTIERAVILREMAYAKDLIEQTSQMLETYETHFFTGTVERSFRIARLYMHAMIYFCEQYDAKTAGMYYGMANRVLDAVGETGELKDKRQELRQSLWHNYLGVMRNEDPQEVLRIVDEYLDSARKSADDFRKVNDLLMAGMCYKSAHLFDLSETLLWEAQDTMEKILENRGNTYAQLTDPAEQESYINVYLRLCQAAHERLIGNRAQVSFAELKIAMTTMDNFIGRIIHASQCGYGYWDMLKMELMTTSALLRLGLAVCLQKSGQHVVHLRTNTRLSVQDLQEEAYRAVQTIRKCYGDLDRLGVAYNKIQGMHNQLNCACIYAGFGDFDRAIALLDELLARYEPKNPQEETVYQLMRRKRGLFILEKCSKIPCEYALEHA